MRLPLHGRIGALVIYDFYMKIILGFTVFWYTLLTGFSAQSLFDDGYLVCPHSIAYFLNILPSPVRFACFVSGSGVYICTGTPLLQCEGVCALCMASSLAVPSL